MEAIILVIHLLLALGIVGVVLLQRSEGGALGIGGGGGGGGGGFGGLVGGRAAGNFLTKSTAVLAGLFFVTSIVLSILAGGGPGTGSIVTDGIGETPAGAMGTHSEGVEAPAVPGSGAPEPSGPSVPLDE